MSQLTYDEFNLGLSQDQADAMVNHMPVDYHDFGKYSSYFGRLYGVITGKENFNQIYGTYTGENPDGSDDFVGLSDFIVNDCARRAIWKTLQHVTADVEYRVGFNISERFHSQLYIGKLQDVYQTDWPGIDAIDVVETYNDIPALDGSTINYALLTGLTATLDGTINEYVLTVDGSVVQNPHEIIVRNNVTTGVIPIKWQQAGYPRKVGGNWEIVLDSTKAGMMPGAGEIDVYSTRYAYVDVPATVTVGELVPVYPNSNQRIRLVRDPETLGSGDIRYWFNVYELVNKDFYFTNVNLVHFDYYKLLETIDFKDVVETEQKAILYVNCKCDIQACCDTCECEAKRYQLSTEIVSDDRGTVCFNVDGELDSEDVLDTTSKFTRSSDEFYKIQFHYKTSPYKLGRKWSTKMGDLVRAIVYRTASELPFNDCGCEIKTGFIYEQQKSFGKIFTTITGEKVSSFKYGDMNGQRVYAEIMERTARYTVVMT